MSANNKDDPSKSTSNKKTPVKQSISPETTKLPEGKSAVVKTTTSSQQQTSSEHGGSSGGQQQQEQPSKSLTRSMSWAAETTQSSKKVKTFAVSPSPKKSTTPQKSAASDVDSVSTASQKSVASSVASKSASSKTAKSVLQSKSTQQPPKKQISIKSQTPKSSTTKSPPKSIGDAAVKSVAAKSTPSASPPAKSPPPSLSIPAKALAMPASKSPPTSPGKISETPTAVVPAKTSASTTTASVGSAKQPKILVEIPTEVLSLPIEKIVFLTKDLERENKIQNVQQLTVRHDCLTCTEKIRMNNERIKANIKLPWMVATLVEILEMDTSDPESENGATANEPSKEKCAIVKTSSRTTYFLPNLGLLDPATVKPGDFVGVNKDTHVIYEKLPVEYDSRIKSMELIERPKEKFTDIGGLDKQLQEMREAVMWPLTKKEKFKKLGIAPPKGVLLFGPPGTGKTMMARTVAAQTKCAFLKLAASQLVQMYIGDGAKMVRDAFALAKEKAPTIIFIDEIDALGTKRYDSEKAGDREVQRTMLELLNQLDGFQPNDDIKIIAATNRVDVLDPALVRSGRLDRKIELPLPDQKARARIMQIHSQKMTIEKTVNFDELSRCTDDFNGAQCRAVCVEAGMIALRRNASVITHEDFMDGILEVQAKKKTNLNYYA